MGWAKFTDQRAMNRKLRAVGFAARGLDEAAICQVSSDMSDGYISEETVETLAVAHRCKTWRKLVESLVQEDRWEPVDGGWLIHDYLEYNPTRAEWEAEQDKKREAGRKGGIAKAKAEAVARATANAKPFATAPAVAPAVPRALANVIADPTRPDPKVVVDPSSSSKVVQRGPKPDDDDDRIAANLQAEAPTPWEAIVSPALRRLAQRDLDRRETERGPVGDEALWLEKATQKRAEKHRETIAQLIAAGSLIDYFEHPQKLADILEPPRTNGTTRGPLNNNLVHLERELKAAQVKGERNDQEPCVTCGTRGGDGWVADEAKGVVSRCPDCSTVPA